MNDELESRIARRTAKLQETNAALRASEARFRSLFEDARTGTLALTPDGRVIEINEACRRMLGGSPATGTRIADRVLAPDRARFETRLADVGTGRLAGAGLEIRGAQGAWLHASLAAVSDSDGNIAQIMAMLQDVTAEREAAHQRDLFFEHSIDMLMIGGFNGSVHWANPACQRILGYPASDRSQISVDIVHFDDLPAVIAAAERLRRGESVELLNLRLRHRDGHYVDTLWNVATWTGENLVLGIGRDVTPLRKAELELRQSEARLRALRDRLERIREEERTAMSREIHDELGQMLTALKMDLMLLARDITRSDDDLDAGRVVDSLQSMSGLADSTISSVRRIAQQLRPEVLDALGLVPAVESLASDFARRTGIVCNVIAPDDEIELEVELRTALYRITQEALTNVARHARARTVSIGVCLESGAVRLSIEDDGCGISPDAQSGSASLGLLNMQERAAMLGGRFSIRGHPGAGTRVTVEVPVAHDGRGGARA